MDKRFGKLRKVLEEIKKIYSIFAPAAHNKIAWAVVMAGISLLAGPDIITILGTVFFSAAFEAVLGESEILRDYIENKTSSTSGIILISFGLIYHLVSAWINKSTESRPILPEVNVIIKDYLGISIKSPHTLRGVRCLLPLEKIPLYDPPPAPTENPLDQFGISHSFISMHDPNRKTINKNMYKKRAKLLKVWGGSEIFNFEIKNEGSNTIKKAKIKVTIQSDGDVYIGFNEKPSIPSKEYNLAMFQPGETIDSIGTSQIYNRLNDDGIFSDDDWVTEEILPGDTAKCELSWAIRALEDVIVKFEVLADGLDKPIKQNFSIKPSELVKNLSIKEIVDDDLFNQIALKDCIMPGYIDQEYQEMYKQMKRWNADQSLP